MNFIKGIKIPAKCTFGEAERTSSIVAFDIEGGVQCIIRLVQTEMIRDDPHDKLNKKSHAFSIPANTKQYTVSAYSTK